MQGVDSLETFFGVGEEAVLAKDCETVPEHVEVSYEGGAEVGCEAVLGDARLVSGLKKLILEAGLDHPPTDGTLEADKAADASQTPGHGLANPFTHDKVDGGQEEGDADHSAPESVSPFHPVDLLEVFKVHVRVEHLELRTLLVAVVFIFPMLLVHRRQ